MSQQASSGQSEHPRFAEMRKCDTTGPSVDASHPLEESFTGCDPDLYSGAPTMPVDQGDTPWAEMYPATGRGTSQATVNSAPLAPFHAPAWVSPSVAATLASMFDVEGYIRDRSLLQVESGTSTGSSASIPPLSKQHQSDTMTSNRYPAERSQASVTQYPAPNFSTIGPTTPTEDHLDDLEDDLGSPLSEADLRRLEEEADEATKRLAAALRASKKRDVTGLGVSKEQVEAILCARSSHGR